MCWRLVVPRASLLDPPRGRRIMRRRCVLALGRATRGLYPCLRVGVDVHSHARMRASVSVYARARANLAPSACALVKTDLTDDLAQQAAVFPHVQLEDLRPARARLRCLGYRSCREARQPVRHALLHRDFSDTGLAARVPHPLAGCGRGEEGQSNTLPENLRRQVEWRLQPAEHIEVLPQATNPNRVCLFPTPPSHSMLGNAKCIKQIHAGRLHNHFVVGVSG